MTSTIGTPVWISRTAWYRCSMRLRSTYTRPRISRFVPRMVEPSLMS